MSDQDFWGLTDQWIKAVRDRYKGRSSSDLTQVFARGPFAGWSEREVKELADLMHERSKKYPRWTD